VKPTITIARLLPDMLGLNGSTGNSLVLQQLMDRMGLVVSVVDVNGPEDAVPDVDIVCVGSGSGSSVTPAAGKLLSLVTLLNQWQQNGAYFFAVGVGWDLLGKHIVLPNGETLPGVGIFPSVADHRIGRFSGEVYGPDYRGRQTAGYVNQVGSHTLEGDVQPLLTVERSTHSWQVTDGLVGRNMMATKLGGPLLSLNPHVALDIIESVAVRRSLETPRSEFLERVESLSSEARRLIVDKLQALPR
jgi:CobQ-like glutamine amidotransferase family enzyme